MRFGEGAVLEKMHEIIFEADTRAGKIFDIVLLIIILLSVFVVLVDSVPIIHENNERLLIILEWIFTIIFSIEYIMRIISSKRPAGYIFSFFGIIDLLSILPAFIGLIFAGGHYLLTIRALRLLRVFRIFKLAQFVVEGNNLIIALRKSRRKITIFLLFVLMVTTFMGSLMYVIESNQDSGFTSIPRSIYWAVVTLTTVGYGDIAPSTNFGQFIAAIMMILGYAVIAVPTGIVGAEIAQQNSEEKEISTQACAYCAKDDHEYGANYCNNCGGKL